MSTCSHSQHSLPAEFAFQTSLVTKVVWFQSSFLLLLRPTLRDMKESLIEARHSLCQSPPPDVRMHVGPFILSILCSINCTHSTFWLLVWSLAPLLAPYRFASTFVPSVSRHLRSNHYEFPTCDLPSQLPAFPVRASVPTPLSIRVIFS